MKSVAISFTSFFNAYWDNEVELQQIDIAKFGCHSLSLFPNSFGIPLPIHDSMDELKSEDSTMTNAKTDLVPKGLAYIHNSCCTKPDSLYSEYREKRSIRLSNSNAEPVEVSGSYSTRLEIDENILAKYDQFKDWLLSGNVEVWFRNTGNYDSTHTNYSRQCETYRRRGCRVYYRGWHEPVYDKHRQLAFSFA